MQTCKLPRLQSSRTIQVSIMRRWPESVAGSEPRELFSSSRVRSGSVAGFDPCDDLIIRRVKHYAEIQGQG